MRALVLLLPNASACAGTVKRLWRMPQMHAQWQRENMRFKWGRQRRVRVKCPCRVEVEEDPNREALFFLKMRIQFRNEFSNSAHKKRRAPCGMTLSQDLFCVLWEVNSAFSRPISRMTLTEDPFLNKFQPRVISREKQQLQNQSCSGIHKQ